MVLKEILERFRAKRTLLKQMKDQDRMEEMVQQLKKSSNERELERFIKERREEEIKVQLNKFREKEKIKDRGASVLSNKNVFHGQGNILKDNKKLFSMAVARGKESFMFHKGGFGG